MNSKVKGWMGYLMMAWPVIKLIAQYYHINLPEVPGNLGDILAAGTIAAGGTMVATAAPIMGKEAKK